MTKLRVAFHNIAKSVEKRVHSRICHVGCKFRAVENFNHHCKPLPKERTLKFYYVEAIIIHQRVQQLTPLTTSFELKAPRIRTTEILTLFSWELEQ